MNSQTSLPKPFDESAATATRRRNGILPARAIAALIDDGHIAAAAPIAADQIQPASLDVRLGARAWRLPASFLPTNNMRVAPKRDRLAIHSIDLEAGAVLETGCVYLVELMETLDLPDKIAAIANPKSSTGRIDVFVRLLTDYGTGFDAVKAGYKGSLYLEISPRSFPVRVKAGSRLAQIRFQYGRPQPFKSDMEDLHEAIRLIDGTADIARGGIALSVALAGDCIGYRAKRHTQAIDIDLVGALPVADYWDTLHGNAEAELTLDPSSFYILASREEVRVPATHAAELVPFDPQFGEFRTHYAGFFDPGFGLGDKGSRAVLEIRARDVPFVLTDGQLVGRLVYTPLTEAPENLYGRATGAHYQAQGLKLSKHFA